MAQVNLGDYKNLYIETLKKAIGSLHEQCDKLTNNALDKEAINNLHIIAHSLKGRSQVMGFANVANLSEIIEKSSDEALKGTAQLSTEDILNIKKEVGKLSDMLKQVQQDTGTGETI